MTAPSGQRGGADLEGTGVCLFQNQGGDGVVDPILLVFQNHFSAKQSQVGSDTVHEILNRR